MGWKVQKKKLMTCRVAAQLKRNKLEVGGEEPSLDFPNQAGGFLAGPIWSLVHVFINRGSLRDYIFWSQSVS